MKICTRPCDSCPFRSDLPSIKGWLTEDRMQGIVDMYIMGDKTFFCHKTYNDTDMFKQSVCAGALLLEKQFNPQGNASSRMLMSLGLLKSDYSGISGREKIFATLPDLCRAHRNEMDGSSDYSEWYKGLEERLAK